MNGLPLTWDFLAVPQAVPEVRQILRERFDGEDAGDLLLCVSELLANVITHVGERTPVALRVSATASGRVRVAVSDPAAAVWPMLRESGPEGTSGRGLQLLDALALRWGVDQSPHRKTVWCELRTPTRRAGLRPGEAEAAATRYGTRTGSLPNGASCC
ncbi:ATP-binding protein [Streptomyces sp. NPDC008163]|uniref:ATP-binding protein n=1 Tax=Streptomyces sp. NPDC008163 TaxID=3364818 RepID=UPI0036F0CFE3